MNPPIQTLAPLSPLEISGALSARLLHDLSNLVSGIIGNAEYAQRSQTDPESLAKTLNAISLSANAAGKLIGQCLPMQQLVNNAAFPFDAVEQATMIAEAAGLAPGWKVALTSKLEGQIAVEPRWLAIAVMQIARETDARMGEIQFACGPAVHPVAWSAPNSDPANPPHLFQIHLSYKGDSLPLPGLKEIDQGKYALFAATELIRRFKGQIQTRANPPGRHEIIIMLPLI